MTSTERAATVPNRERTYERASFKALVAEIRARREEIEAVRAMPADIVAGMKACGVYRAAVPARFGGDGETLPDLLRMIRVIAGADGSAGWVATFGPQMASFLGAMERGALDEYYRDGPDVIGAGALFPLQKARLDGDEIEVSGRWKFGSGCLHAEWLSVGVLLDEDRDPKGTPVPRVVLFRPSEVEIVENWDVVGLVATGSHDLQLRSARAPLARSFLRNAPPSYDEPLYRINPVVLTAMLFGAVAAGIAADCLDEVATLALGKVSMTGGERLADKPAFQTDYAWLRTRLAAAEAVLVGEAEGGWHRLTRGETLAAADDARMRMAAVFAADTAGEVARHLYNLAGTTAIYRSNPLQRHLRDIGVVSQHAFVNRLAAEQCGRAMLGV